MKTSVKQQLLQINEKFYQAFAEAFAATRYAAQPGWQRIIPYFPARCQVLDLGCGNGRFARFLDEHLDEVHYVGIDGSARLLAIAREQAQTLTHIQAEFHLADLARPGWSDALRSRRFDVVAILAALHHIPGFDSRAALVRAAADLLVPEGVLILSTWRFTHNPRMRRKIVPWEQVRLGAEDVEPDDYLLDWKKEGVGYRYAHELDEEETRQMLDLAGLRMIEQFHADGREGDLSLYSVAMKTADEA
ncbi:MAG: class I SAM-dependent methyltransferase [Chloroflexi bacterium]|nr:class I SAM-dependent methyltransferase [Chloroflexota bacterium]